MPGCDTYATATTASPWCDWDTSTTSTTGTSSTFTNWPHQIYTTANLYAQTTTVTNEWFGIRSRLYGDQYVELYKSFLAGIDSNYKRRAWRQMGIERALDGCVPCPAQPDQSGAPDGPIPVPRVYEPPQVVVPSPSREADNRAERLLRSVLSPEQVEQYERNKTIDVRSQSGKLYRLHNDRIRNVRLLSDVEKRPAMGYCIHPRDNVPLADVLVAQKLLLEADEERFLRTANAFAV